MRRLLIVRHGQSVWNMDSKFTGWTNIPLTGKGEQEAKSMALVLNKYKWTPKVIFTCVGKICKNMQYYKTRSI